MNRRLEPEVSPKGDGARRMGRDARGVRVERVPGEGGERAAGGAPRAEDRFGRSRAIDGSRGVAILAVMAVHTAYAWPALGRGVVQAASLGRYGVDLFFVVSGWVLAHLYFATPEGRRPGLTERLRARALRLAPLYWLGVLGYGVAGRWWGWASDGSTGELAANLGFWNAWDEARANAVVPGGWSISVEFWAGAALLAVLPWLNAAGRALTIWLGLVVVSRLWPAGGTGDTPWMHLPSFVLGVAAWHVMRSERWRRAGGWWSGCLVLGAAAGIASLHPALLGVADRAVQAGAAGFLLVLAAGRAEWRSRAASVLVWLGTQSYGLYLGHFAMLELAVWLTVVALPSDAPAWGCAVLSFGLTLGLSIPLAWCLDRKVDRPLRRWIGREYSPGSRGL